MKASAIQKLAGTLNEITSGTVTFDGQDITELPTHMISRLSIAQSPEGRRIFPRMTVFENLLVAAMSTQGARLRNALAGDHRQRDAAAEAVWARLREFDLVLEKYPSDNNKIPDALYYKGMTLTRMGKRTAGAEEFKELYKRFPSHDLARQACSQLQSMGLRCASTGAAATKAGVRRKG